MRERALLPRLGDRHAQPRAALRGDGQAPWDVRRGGSQPAYGGCTVRATPSLHDPRQKVVSIKAALSSRQ